MESTCFRKKKNKNFVTLSLGEAFLKTKKLNLNRHFSEANFHYSDSRGIPELRNKIARMYKKKHGVKIDPRSEILISAGSKILSFMSLLALLNKGEEVYTFEPAWLSYRDQVNILGSKIKYLPIETKLSDLNKKIKKNCKIFILNNPNNPSGKLYSKIYLKKLLKILIKKKIFLLCDEAYSEFVSSPEIFSSSLELKKYKKKIILINSFSKNFSMSGWRIGYLVASKEIVDKLLILNQHLITCAPTILQNIVSYNFDKLYNHNKKEIKKLLKKRNIIKKEFIKNKIQFIEGNCTIYFFVKIPKVFNVEKLCKFLIEKKNISLVPGNSYGINTSNYIRVSIGTEQIKKIKYFISILRKIFDRKIMF